MKRIAIDLTPMLPGGDNGGIKPLAIELVRHLGRLAAGCEFVLLTSDKSHEELAFLESANVRRLCVSRPEGAATPSLERAFAVRRLLQKILPAGAVQRLGALYARFFDSGGPAESPLLRRLGVELLFCPFTGIFFFDPAVPVVCVVADLQYLYYPQFFSPEARHERDRHFRHVCRSASRLVCISEYTRKTVLEQSEVTADRTAVVWIAAQERLARPDHAVSEDVLARLGLRPGRFLLYPANFWRHKNHEMLLIAFGMYRARKAAADSDVLKLVLTGADSPRRAELAEAARRMGLEEQVIFAGFLPDRELAALFEHCAAMIFPSLFEGFGMPVLEAMAAGVPVLCSDLTSLPEVAGPPDEPAALLFDPRRPQEIVDAIVRLESDPALRQRLIERGRRWAQALPSPADMAARYWEVFEDAVRNPLERPTAVYGVFPDAWIGERVTVIFGKGATPRQLILSLHAPDWLAAAEITIRVEAFAGASAKLHRIARGQRQTITLALPGESGMVELLCSPTFRPGGADHRELGCLLESAAIAGPEDAGPEGRPLPREVHAA